MVSASLRTLIAVIALELVSAFSPAKPRHLVLIVADDLGYADLGYTGSEIRTPNIDGLANAGVKVANFYVQRACSPTRAALMTGRYNIRYGFQSGVLTDHNNYSLPLTETLLPQFVHRTLAAKTHAVGKWHLGYHRWEHTPTFRGFDSYLGCALSYRTTKLEPARGTPQSPAPARRLLGRRRLLHAPGKLRRLRPALGGSTGLRPQLLAAHVGGARHLLHASLHGPRRVPHRRARPNDQLVPLPTVPGLIRSRPD